MLLHSLGHACFYMASMVLWQGLWGITLNNRHGILFSKKQSRIKYFVYKTLILKTANHQHVTCLFKYCTSVKHINQDEISTWCKHSNERCFQRKEKKELIVIKLMKDETSLKISLCSKPGSVTSNGYLKSSKAVGAVISPDNLSGYLPVTKIRMFFALISNHKSLATLEHFLFCASWPVKTIYFHHLGHYLLSCFPVVFSPPGEICFGAICIC